MSLDYLFLKATGPVEEIDELEQDESFTVEDYMQLGARLFPGIGWDEDSCAVIALAGESTIELEASDQGLMLQLRGMDVDPELVLRPAAQCRDENVVVIDVQTSDLITAEDAAENVDEYMAWYRSVLRRHE